MRPAHSFQNIFLVFQILYSFTAMKSSDIALVCSPYVAPFLTEELNDLGYAIKSSDHLTATVEGNMEDAMKLNLHLRMANRVLFLLHQFTAGGPNDLYKEALNYDWGKLLRPGGYFHIHSVVKNEHIRDNRFANLKLKDAIADHFFKKYGKRPDSGPEKTKTVFFLHWSGDSCKIYLDTSGETTAKHGYRINPWKAPMIESLAAAVVRATGWDKKSPFVNPMCGSGTLAIEAALAALDIAPGLFRRNFGFMHIREYDEAVWNRLKSHARNSIKTASGLEIIASDVDPKAIAAAKMNAEEAGVDASIRFISCDFRKTPVPRANGTVILNPEYGVRMGGTDQLEEVYSEIGDFFKKNCPGYKGFIFTGNLDLAKKVGLRAKTRKPFLNGKLECRLLEYELYAGSKKR